MERGSDTGTRLVQLKSCLLKSICEVPLALQASRVEETFGARRSRCGSGGREEVTNGRGPWRERMEAIV